MFRATPLPGCLLTPGCAYLRFCCHLKCAGNKRSADQAFLADDLGRFAQHSAPSDNAHHFYPLQATCPNQGMVVRYEVNMVETGVVVYRVRREPAPWDGRETPFPFHLRVT